MGVKAGVVLLLAHELHVRGEGGEFGLELGLDGHVHIGHIVGDALGTNLRHGVGIGEQPPGLLHRRNDLRKHG